MNHRILVIDDNAAIHEDIRKILAPPKPMSVSLEDEEALLFGDASAAGTAAHFDIDSAHQGQEGLDQLGRDTALEALRTTIAEHTGDHGVTYQSATWIIQARPR